MTPEGSRSFRNSSFLGNTFFMRLLSNQGGGGGNTFVILSFFYTMVNPFVFLYIGQSFRNTGNKDLKKFPYGITSPPGIPIRNPPSCPKSTTVTKKRTLNIKHKNIRLKTYHSMDCYDQDRRRLKPLLFAGFPLHCRGYSALRMSGC